MQKNQDTRTLYTIACACGEKATMDARSFGRPTVCRKCGKYFTVAWGKHPTTGKSVPLAVSLARKRAATPLQVVCACGYRRAVTASEAAGHNRCPGCGKVMIVEKPAAKNRESDRIIKLSSAEPGRPQDAKPVRRVQLAEGTKAFDCVCGERLLVRGFTIGHEILCPACDRRILVEMKAGLPPTPAPVPPGSRTPTPPPGGYEKTGLSCECGQIVEVLKALAAEGTTCPSCRRTITMEKIRNPQSQHTVIRPRFGPKAGAAPVAPIPSTQPKPAPEGVFDNMPAAEFTEEPAPAAADSSYQEVFCPCGEALMVGNEDAGKNIQCPTCLTLIAVEHIRDRTGNAGLRVRAIGKMDEDTWSLSEFK